MSTYDNIASDMSDAANRLAIVIGKIQVLEPILSDIYGFCRGNDGVYGMYAVANAIADVRIFGTRCIGHLIDAYRNHRKLTEGEREGVRYNVSCTYHAVRTIQVLDLFDEENLEQYSMKAALSALMPLLRFMIRECTANADTEDN